MAFVEQVHGLSATSTTGEPVITTPAQPRCPGEDLVSRHMAASSVERGEGRGSALMYIICLKSLQVLEFLLKAGS